MTVIELDRATRYYGEGHTRVVALHEVTVEVRAGELVCVMGPSGCGKSTLLALAGGLERPDAGEVRLFGRRIGYHPRERAERLRARVGYVFQELNLLRDLTALENVSLPLELGGEPLAKARAAARAALASVGLEVQVDAFPAALSGGEQQRVAIARALIGTRRILLADEPTGALGSLAAESVMGLVRRRCDEGAAALVVTHDPVQAATADRVVFLRDGAIAGAATAAAGEPAGRAAE